MTAIATKLTGTTPPPMVRRARRKSRLVPGLAVTLLFLGIGSWGWNKTHSPADPTAKLLTALATQGELTETVAATGSVTSQTGSQVKIGSQVTGRIKHLYTDVGSVVQAGSVIAELDLPDVVAQLRQAKDNLETAQTKLAQQLSGVAMGQIQTSSSVAQARAQLRSAQAKLASAQAADRLQATQTPADIQHARTVLATAQAALSTAKSNLAQAQAGANLQVATAQEQLNQAQANAQNSAQSLKREQALLAKGFVATSEVDSAQAQATVNKSQVETARQNIELVRQKVAADTQAARDAVTQAEQGVESAQAALDVAQAEVNQNTVKRSEIDDARAQVELAKASLTTAQGNVAQNTLKQQDVQQAREAVRVAQEQVAYAQAQVDKTFIRSPLSGTVLQLAAQQGETLAAGLSSPTLIVVADLNRLQVDAFVDETDIGKIKLGQEASVTVDAFPKKVFKGRVTKIASGSTIQQGVVTYDVNIALENTGHQLKPDMTANVTIQTGHKSNVLLVPSEAIKASKRGASVTVLVNHEGKRVPEPRKVTTGATDGVHTEIREGLSPGDTIVLAGLSQSRGPVGGASSPFGPASGGGVGGGRPQ
ncbi:efflux RND transporter periplasmic adaptor subunit [Armatimonas rosea]|uniref:RND family efflux transporter MFP subunit n=1 Tax=Armatimonas rosea TaxID=685828 RepID=A0A7W9W6G7_ARMRO|nr:efflux RND transporter periplasmic adaptor subunit [Armatimonas rosea]MBB6051439.1 RND family efflux transporter MFP subunit [Armatimonas rosea]